MQRSAEQEENVYTIVIAKLDDSFEEFLLDLVPTRSGVGRQDNVLPLCKFLGLLHINPPIADHIGGVVALPKDGVMTELPN